MRSMRWLAVLMSVCPAVLLGIGGGWAAVITVGPSGANHTTVQAAVNAAQAGDEIRVAAGTYNEKVRITTSSLRLLGGWNTIFTVRNPATNVTIIDGQNTRRCIVINGLATSPTLIGGWTIDGFTIRNGRASLASTDIPGVYVPDPLTEQLLTPDDGDLGWGAGIFAYQTSGTLSNCRIESCVSDGVVGVRGAGADGILGNADDTYGWAVANGGGMAFMGSGPCQITTCTFQANQASANTTNPLMVAYGRNSGGALRVEETLGEVSISGCTFTNNTATNNAGAFSIADIIRDPLTVLNCTFTGNSAASHGGALYSGGTTTGPLTVCRCTFTNNSTSNTVLGVPGQNGGAFRFGGNTGTITVEDCTFEGNTSGNNRGVGWIEGYAAPIYFTYCRFLRNASRNDIGALNLDDTDSPNGVFYVTNCTFDGNVAYGAAGTDGNGSALRFSMEVGRAYVDRCLFINNVSTDDNVVYGSSDQSGTATLTNCIFHNNRVLGSGNRFISLEGLNWKLYNCTFTSNSCTGEFIRSYENPDTAWNHIRGIGDWTQAMWDTRRVEVVNCILANNTANVDRHFRGRAATTATMEVVFTRVENNIFYQLAGGSTVAAEPGRYGDAGPAINLDGRLTGNGNFEADPMLVNVAGGNFHLQAASLAVDAGQSLAEVALDMDGWPRPYGPRHDIGADEYAVAPGPPTILATAGDGSVSLSWQAVTDALEYRIYQSQTQGGPYTYVATTLQLQYTVTGLTNGVTYYFVVRAAGAGGESGDSNEASATPQSGVSLRVRSWRGYR